MDNLTHSLVGALIGQAGLKRRTGLAMPALIIGAKIPDIDASCLLWLEGMEHLAFRRGITHGPPALVLLPLVLAGALWGLDHWQARHGKRPEGRLPVRFGWLYALAFVACLTHPALDWLNSYGIRLLEPFSSRWFYGDILFIIDVWLWLGLGLATWLSLRREKTTGGDWRRPARVALAAGLGYIGLNAAITQRAEANPPAAPTGTDMVIANPVPLLFPGRQVITGGEGLYAIDGEALPGVPLQLCDLATARRADRSVDAFLFWSRAPYVEPREDGLLWLRDARFADPPVAPGEEPPAISAGDRFSVRLPTQTCAIRTGAGPVAPHSR